MYRLGLHLTLRSGPEALVRLLVTAAAVAVGVAILLCVGADFNAFQSTNDRPAWEATQGASVNPTGAGAAAATAPAPGVELWNYSESVFEGRTVEQLDLAALGPGAPVPPGVTRLPAAGQYYASPALAALIAATPADELGDRFPGTLAGTVGDQALTGPDELVAYVGYRPAALAALSGTRRVDKIAAGPQTSVWTNYFRYAFGVGALAFTVPILVLIGTASRLAASRREERFAALRLVGATNRQISVIASIEAVAGALLGTLLGLGLFQLVRPALAGASLTGARYFAALVALKPADYLAVLAGVPAACAVAALVSLRRVRISPLGVTRRQTPKAPRATRLLPLGVGLALFLVGLATTTDRAIGFGLYPGLLLVLGGLLVAGPWLTAKTAGLLAAATRRAPSLLAARRLADQPAAAFRAVSGLVLAVFLGSLLAGLLPTVDSVEASPGATSLSDVLVDQFTYAPLCGNDVNCTGSSGPAQAEPSANPTEQQRIGVLGLPPATGTVLLAQLGRFRGATVLPVYSMPQDLQTAGRPNGSGAGSHGPGSASEPPAVPSRAPQYDSILSCSAVAALGGLGDCAPGRTAVDADSSSLFGDNPQYSGDAVVSSSNPAASADFAQLSLQAVLVRVADPATLEQVRTFLATHTPLSESASAPRTFGEEVQARAHVSQIVQSVVDIAVTLTLLVAGCSLAVAVGGGLVERRRPFTLMRLSGTPAGALRRVVLWEAVVPLAAATLAAAALGYAMAALASMVMAPVGTPVPVPGAAYYATMGLGLFVSFAVIGTTLPLLDRLTRPENARFE